MEGGQEVLQGLGRGVNATRMKPGQPAAVACTVLRLEAICVCVAFFFSVVVSAERRGFSHCCSVSPACESEMGRARQGPT